jgi:hypothetical protein
MSSGDRGGVAELNKIIKKSKIPIICICNDRYYIINKKNFLILLINNQIILIEIKQI